MVRRSGASLLILFTFLFIWLLIRKDSVSLQQPNIKKMKRMIILSLLMVLCVGICSAQTIRNTNNSVVAKIDTDGTVRNSNNSVIARINSYGDIRDCNNHLLGKIGSNGDIRDRNNSYMGRVESNGVVRNSNNSTLGKVENDGTVRDSNNHTISYARGVPIRYAAVLFFFNFF